MPGQGSNSHGQIELHFGGAPLGGGLPNVAGGISLVNAQASMTALLPDGTDCPCCGRYIRQYRRKFNSGMARWVIWLSKQKDFAHVRDSPVYGDNRDYGKLVFFGLAESKVNDDTSKRTSGMWRITQDGIDFANDNLDVREYAVTLAGELNCFEGNFVNIRMALGNKWNYEELMRGE